ncbi:YfhO family protein [Geomonas nitrogeniifigens]|uniref:YfhO family protein n=1 Tax=Geomonas diazotrophica TaxID=2843197 RepID=A0ABX8JER9_9BACT|nr:YfhO family protein [Geomonas nitrogeniifigens]QWV96813.1 YfhO family protein [Geomonas nitrogeniifigens]QXE85913.1 YfhO family protein [Geomonas nitrogeniifigens]
MNERRKDLLFLAMLLAVLLLFFSKILFTHQIIRAPDIIAEFYWGVRDYGTRAFLDLWKVNLVADWNIYVNSGLTLEGGGASGQLLFLRNLVFWLFPAPANVAWYIVLHFFFAATGTYYLCRLLGAGRLGAFLGGLIFVLAPENASLINAGHVMKLATISFVPWVFYFFEKGFQTRRLVYFLTTAVVLALQFFHTHWQIAYYTCLAVACYGIARSILILREEQVVGKEFARLLGLNVALLVFFLTTVAISLAPLANWAKETNRGVNSGANVVATSGQKTAKGGLDREEAMSWSMPPEETAAFVIPGLFGFSRQEGGDNPTNIDVYYWGRMNFTQTVSYMGLLPWLLLPLPLIFRRDRYTWLALAAVVVGVLFSMGKYTPFYNLLFDYFPGINRFRVPKMMMFIPVLGLGVLSARAVDLLLDPALRQSREFKRYITGVALVPIALLLFLVIEVAGARTWVNLFLEMLAQPTRYQASSEQLVAQRWGNLVQETGIAAGLSALFAGAYFFYYRGRLSARMLIYLLLALFICDVGRVNAKFLVLTNEPQQVKGVKTPEIQFLSAMPKEYRVIPMDGDPMQYATAGIPVMFTSNPVQQRRWQEFLDSFNLLSSMPDIINVKYLLLTKQQFDQDKGTLLAKYRPAFTSPDGNRMILENPNVLPKAWLTPVAVQVPSATEALGALQNPQFDLRVVALVESAPPIPMLVPGAALPVMGPGQVRINKYEAEKIDLDAAVSMNSMLVMGEKYYKGWKATVDGKPTEIYPVDHVLRGIYLTPGTHKVEMVFDPTPFKIGKTLTLVSFAVFALFLGREVWLARRAKGARP